MRGSKLISTTDKFSVLLVKKSRIRSFSRIIHLEGQRKIPAQATLLSIR